MNGLLWHEDFVSKTETPKMLGFEDTGRYSSITEEPKEPMTSEEMLVRFDKADLDSWGEGFPAER